MESRVRFFFEVSLAFVSGVLFLATLLWPTWIELAFHIAPDQGHGQFESAIVVIAAAITVACSVRARAEWQRRLGRSATNL